MSNLKSPGPAFQEFNILHNLTVIWTAIGANFCATEDEEGCMES